MAVQCDDGSLTSQQHASVYLRDSSVTNKILTAKASLSWNVYIGDKKNLNKN